MEIKVIKSGEKIDADYINNDIFLERRYENSEFDSIKLVKFFKKNINETVSEEILPNIDKYVLGDFINVSDDRTYIYFFNVYNPGQLNMNLKGNITLIRYNLNTEITESLYSFEDNIAEYMKTKRLKIFVVNHTHLLIQTEFLSINSNKNYTGFFNFQIKCLNIKAEKCIDIENENLTKNGISSMYYVSENLCAIKTGFSLLDDNRYNILEKEEASLETAGLINLNEMLSDLELDNTKFNIQVLDQAYFTKTIHYLKVSGDYIYYSFINNETKQEEIKFYNYKTGQTVSCINKDVIRVSNLAEVYIINNEPYVCLKKGETKSFYNIISAKVTARFNGNMELNKVFTNCLLFSGEKRKILSNTIKPFITLYSFPEKNVLFTENASYIDAVETDENNIYIIDNIQ